MYTTVKSISTQRITEVREYLDFFTPLIPSPPTATPRYLNTSKGLVFVQLYGIIEYTINSTISRTIDLINNELIKLQDTSPFIWGMALNPQLDALVHVNRKKWDKRFELFLKMSDNDEVSIANTIMPTSGENFTYNQLESIWKTFNITEPLFNDVSFRGRLQEIVSNRVNISHGNNSASEVGSRVTPTDLSDRINDVSSYCSYFICVFENYINKKEFRK